MTGTHVVLWGISQVAMKFVEDQRIGLEPIEKSTRYVHFGNKVGGRYLYYVPKPDLERLGRLGDYTATLDHLFDTYVELLDPLQAWLQAHFDEKHSILEKKAFDTLRGLLPMATLGQVALRGNAQAFEYLLNRTARHPLGELRWLSTALKAELDEEIPSLLLRLSDAKSQDYQEYLVERHALVREFAEHHSSGPARERISAGVKLVEWDPEAEMKILAGVIFAESHLEWSKAVEIVRKLSLQEKKDLLERYLAGRSARWYKVGRSLENAYLRFEIVMDIGSYRDLHRHRMMTQERQMFSTHHGYDVPSEITEAGFANRFTEALEGANSLFRKLEFEDPGACAVRGPARLPRPFLPVAKLQAVLLGNGTAHDLPGASNISIHRTGKIPPRERQVSPLEPARACGYERLQYRSPRDGRKDRTKRRADTFKPQGPECLTNSHSSAGTGKLKGEPYGNAGCQGLA